jgi:hypothetical protein
MPAEAQDDGAQYTEINVRELRSGLKAADIRAVVAEMGIAGSEGTRTS